MRKRMRSVAMLLIVCVLAVGAIPAPAQEPGLVVSTPTVLNTQGGLTVTVGLRNNGESPALNVQVTGVTVAVPVAYTGPLPVAAGTIPVATKGMVTLRFAIPALHQGDTMQFAVKGTFQNATGKLFYFGSNRVVRVPDAATPDQVAEAACIAVYTNFTAAVAAGDTAKALALVAPGGYEQTAALVKGLTAEQRSRITEFLPPLVHGSFGYEKFRAFPVEGLTLGAPMSGYVTFVLSLEGTWQLFDVP